MRLAIEQDGAEIIVLGYAGMADLCGWLSEHAGIPVIDGVTAATRLAEAMIGAGYRTSKAGAYAYRAASASIRSRTSRFSAR